MSDLETWAENLSLVLRENRLHYERLRAAAEGRSDEAFDAECDPAVSQAAATACAAQAVSQIVIALDKLPALQGQFRDGPMTDLLAALGDLQNGRRSPMFSPWPGENGKLSTQMTMVKTRAVFAVLALQRAGDSDASARRTVAQIFSDAGHVGKKGGRLSAKSIFDWCIDCEPDHSGTPEQRAVAKNLDLLPCDLTRDVALRLVRTEASKRL